MERLAELPGIDDISLTTNGVLTAPHVPALARLGVKAVNLSLDTLDRERFFQITRRDELPKVMETFYALLDAGIQVKINAVVMDGQNIDDLIPLADLSRDLPWMCASLKKCLSTAVATRLAPLPFLGTTSASGSTWRTILARLCR